jgi:diguanylate cyclase (GGDEF)-like protein
LRCSTWIISSATTIRTAIRPATPCCAEPRRRSRVLRAGDLIARYGGEEFAVLLHGCDGTNALKFFERLHGAMLEGQTFSAGVAESDGKEEGSAAVQRADEALYRAKAGGRNQTLLAERARAAA